MYYSYKNFRMPIITFFASLSLESPNGVGRYFPIAKDKLYFLLDQHMPNSLDEIENDSARNALKRFNNGAEFQTVSFERTYANNPETVLVSADRVDCARPFNVVELKVYQGKENVLKEAIRYVLYNFPVVQTTHGKLDLVRTNHNP